MSSSAGTPTAEPFSLIHGASWLTPDGAVIPIPGFHEEWLREHEDLAEGARNACELVLRKRWVSVALFDGGYLELMVHDRRVEEVRHALFHDIPNLSEALVHVDPWAPPGQDYHQLTGHHKNSVAPVE